MAVDRAARLLRARPLVAALAALLLASLVFVALPGIDLAASHLFFDDGFPAGEVPALVVLRDAARHLTAVVSVALAAAALLALLVRPVRWAIGREVLFLGTSLVLGPLLVVRVLLKGFWGRARPENIADFGGDALFSRAWEIAGQCTGSCSFVSGEASASFWLVAFAFIVPARWRLPVAVGTLVFSAAVSLNRVGFGAHFLSDIVLAWFITLAAILVCHALIFGAARGPARRAAGRATREAGQFARRLGAAGAGLAALPHRVARRGAASPPPRFRLLADRVAPVPLPLVHSLLAALLLATLVFVLRPEIDLAVSRLFHVPEAGFFAAADPVLGVLREIGRGVSLVVGLALVPALLLAVFAPARAFIPGRAALFLSVSLLLGPILIVDRILKAFWGRARPRDIIEFGGTQPFSPAWAIVDHCERNCSFTSGEASGSIWLVAFAFIVPRQWRAAVLTGTLAFALAMSLNRIAFGGHFLSDVVLSWLITLLVIVVVHRWVYAPLTAAPTAPAAPPPAAAA